MKKKSKTTSSERIKNISYISFIGLLLMYVGWDGVKDIYVRANDLIKKSRLERELKFSESERGILVCGFEGEEEVGRGISLEYYTILSSRIAEQSLNGVKVKKLDKLLGIKIKSFEQAHELAKKTNAKLVIWGGINSNGVYPSIAILSSNDANEFKDIPILKDSLRNLDDNKPKDIRFYEITDEPISFIAFAIGYEHYINKDYLRARKYFYEATPRTDTNYINRDKIFLYQALSELHLNNYKSAIGILRRKVNYKNDIYSSTLLSLATMLDEVKSNGFEEMSKALLDVEHDDPNETWKRLDKIYEAYLKSIHNINDLEFDFTIKGEEFDCIKKINDYDIADFINVRKDQNEESLKWFFNFYLLKQDAKKLEELISLTEESKDQEILEQRLLACIILKQTERLNREIEKSKRYNRGEKFAEYIKTINIFMDQKELEQAVDSIDEYWLHNSFFVSFFAAQVFFNKKDYTKCLEIYNSILTNFSDHVYIYKYRAQVYEKINMQKEAEDDFVKYLNTYGNDIDVILDVFGKYFDTPEQIKRNAQLFSNIKFSEISFDDVMLEQEQSRGSKNVPAVIDQDFVYKALKNIADNNYEEVAAVLLEKAQNEDSKYTRNRFAAAYYYYLLSILHYWNLDFWKANKYLSDSFRKFPTKDIFNAFLLFSNPKSSEIYALMQNPEKFKATLLYDLINLNLLYLDKSREEAINYINSQQNLQKYCAIMDVEATLYILKNDFFSSYERYKKFSECSNQPIKINKLIYNSLVQDDCESTLLLFEETRKENDLEEYNLKNLAELSICYQVTGHPDKRTELKKYIMKKAMDKGISPINIFFSGY